VVKTRATKGKKDPEGGPHCEEGQDKAESAHTNAEGAGVVMSEENRPAHAECAGCDGECFGDRVSGKGVVGESQEEDSEACSGEGSEDSSLYAFSTWSREAERLPTPTPPATPVKKKSRARSKKKRATASDACSGDTGESQEEDAAAAAVVKLHGATWSDEEEEGDSDPAEMLRLLVDALNQQKEEKGKKERGRTLAVGAGGGSAWGRLAASRCKQG